jgi:hypothetical protein
MSLTIEAIDSLLWDAEAELAKAKDAMDKAVARQKRWMTEVESLNNLKKIRMEEKSEQAVNVHAAPPVAAPAPTPTEIVVVPTELGISHIDWIAAAVVASGDRGMNVPEIVATATSGGVKMHPNYPYTALRNLVQTGRLKKVGLRYFKPGGQLSQVA